MAFCTQCGKELEENASFCSGCGAVIGQEKGDSEAKKKFDALFDSPDHSDEFDSQDISENKVISIFSYISWLVLVPLIGRAHSSKFARFHANQGLVLAIASTGWGVAYAITTAILNLFFRLIGMRILGTLLLLPLGAVNIVMSAVFFALMVNGIVNVACGKSRELPIVGKFNILK